MGSPECLPQCPVSAGLRKQEANANLEQRPGSLNRLTAHNLNVIGELSAVHRETQRPDGSNLEPRVGLEQTT